MPKNQSEPKYAFKTKQRCRRCNKTEHAKVTHTYQRYRWWKCDPKTGGCGRTWKEIGEEI